MEKLELEKDIPYPVYLAPHVLKKELNLGAITIDNEQEIFIQKPLTIQNVEKELIKIKELSEQSNQLKTDNNNLKNQLTNLESLFKSSVFVFQRQQQAIDNLNQKLSAEQTRCTNSITYQQNLQKDVKYLALSRKELQLKAKNLFLSLERLKD